MIDVKTVFSSYRSSFLGMPGYIAGLPSYPRNFSRDVFLSGILAMDTDQLMTQLALSAAHQGRHNDPLTGEELGKIHHEYPGVKLVGRGDNLTTYNACDTAALFLIALEALRHLDSQLFAEQAKLYERNVVLAVSYILSHVKHNLFTEFPPGGASRFALKVTYWKDSMLPSPESPETIYPVQYALAHFQAARGLIGAARLLDNTGLWDAADAMIKAGIEIFMRPDRFSAVISKGVTLEQTSSDELHCLAYIPKHYRTRLPLQAIKHRAKELATPIGFACTPQHISDTLVDRYHGYVVWPFEQAYIHYAATKFGLTDIAGVAKRAARHIESGNEVLSVVPQVTSIGNDRQLWSVAATEYFSGRSDLFGDSWL